MENEKFKCASIHFEYVLMFLMEMYYLFFSINFNIPSAFDEILMEVLYEYLLSYIQSLNLEFDAF